MENGTLTSVRTKKTMEGILGLKVDEKKLDLLSCSVILSVLNKYKGWDWVLEQKGEMTHIKWEFSVRTMGLERNILTVKDEKAKDNMFRAIRNY